MSSSLTTSPTVTNDVVLLAAHDLIVESGVSKLTVQAVATRADVSRMTVYRRHGNLDGIIRHLMTAEIGALLAKATAGLDDVAPARAAATRAVVLTVRELSSHPLFRSVVETDASVLLPLLTTRFGSGQTILREGLAGLLRRGMTRFGGDGSIGDADPDELAFLIVIACQSFVVSGPVVDENVENLGAQLERLMNGWLA